MTDKITDIINRLLAVSRILNEIDVRGNSNLRALGASIDAVQETVKSLMEIQNELKEGDKDA